MLCWLWLYGAQAGVWVDHGWEARQYGGVHDAITITKNERPRREKLAVWLRGIECTTVLDWAAVDCGVWQVTPGGAARAGEGTIAEHDKKIKAHNMLCCTV